MRETRPGQYVPQKKLRSLTTWIHFVILARTHWRSRKGRFFLGTFLVFLGLLQWETSMPPCLWSEKVFLSLTGRSWHSKIPPCGGLRHPLQALHPWRETCLLQWIGSSEIVQSFALILTHTKNMGGVLALCPTKAVQSMHWLRCLTLSPGLGCEDGSNCSVYAQNHRLVDIFPC